MFIGRGVIGHMSGCHVPGWPGHRVSIGHIVQVRARPARPDGDRKEEIKWEQLASHWVSIAYQLNEGPSGVKCRHHHHMRTRRTNRKLSQHWVSKIYFVDVTIHWLLVQYLDITNKYMSLITFTITWRAQVSSQKVAKHCALFCNFPIHELCKLVLLSLNKIILVSEIRVEGDWQLLLRDGKIGEIRVWSTVSGLFLVFMFSNLSLNFVYR